MLSPTPHSRLGELLMVGVRGAAPDDPALTQDLDACAECGVTSVILFDTDARTREPRNIRSPQQTRALTHHVRQRLGPNAVIAVDQEGGAVARLNPARGFPPTITAADFAALDEPAQRAAATQLARTVADAGFNLNFAPCVDVAREPRNAVVVRNGRTFSDDPETVAACAARVVSAHHAAHIAPCLKHFPGHGSSFADSHHELPDITRTFDAASELLPYQRLFAQQQRAGAPILVMTGHLLDANADPDHPASLSHAHTTGVLRDKLNFRGVVVTDSLDMRAVANRHAPDEALLLALNAGADLLLDARNATNDAPAIPTNADDIRAMRESLDRALRDNRIRGGEQRIAHSLARLDALHAWLRR